MQGLINNYLNRYYIIEEHRHSFGVFNIDTCFPVKPRSLIHEIATVFSISEEESKQVIAFWSLFTDVTRSLDDYLKEPDGYIYAPYLPMQATPAMAEPYTENLIDYGVRKSMMERYSAKLINPAYYGVIDINP